MTYLWYVPVPKNQDVERIPNDIKITTQNITMNLANNNEDNTDIEDNGWNDGNNRVKRQVMLANDLAEQKRDSDLRRKNLKLVKKKLFPRYNITDDDQDESVTSPCYICSRTLLNILCPTCGKPSNFEYYDDTSDDNNNDNDNSDNENNRDEIEWCKLNSDTNQESTDNESDDE